MIKQPAPNRSPNVYRTHPVWLLAMVAAGAALVHAVQPWLLQRGVVAIPWLAWLLAGLVGVAWFGMSYLSHGALILVGLPLAGFFLRDGIGRPLGPIGVALWWLGFAFTFLLVAYYYARYLIPTTGHRETNRAFRMVIDATNGASDLGDRYQVKPLTLPASFARFGVGTVESHQALIVRKQGQVMTDIDPGFLMLEPKQVIEAVIDLRPTYRAQSVRITTRDGIHVQTAVSVLFHIRRPHHNPDPNIPFPYDRNALFEAYYAITIDEQGERISWTDRVAPRAAAYLVEELSSVTLDQIFPVNDPDANPLLDIRARVSERLSRQFEAQGIDIVSVGIGRFDLPDDINQQRVEQWQRAWQKRIDARQKARAGRGIGRIDPEDARIQMEVLDELVENIRALRDAGRTSLSRSVAEQLEARLRRIAADGAMRTLIPPSNSDKS